MYSSVHLTFSEMASCTIIMLLVIADTTSPLAASVSKKLTSWFSIARMYASLMRVACRSPVYIQQATSATSRIDVTENFLYKSIETRFKTKISYQSMTRTELQLPNKRIPAHTAPTTYIHTNKFLASLFHPGYRFSSKI